MNTFTLPSSAAPGFRAVLLVQRGSTFRLDCDLSLALPSGVARGWTSHQPTDHPLAFFFVKGTGISAYEAADAARMASSTHRYWTREALLSRLLFPSPPPRTAGASATGASSVTQRVLYIVDGGATASPRG